MSRARLAVLALAATTLIAAGCGSSTNSSTKATTDASTPSTPTNSLASSSTVRTSPLTRSELVAKADAICTRIATRRNLLKFGRTNSLEVILPQVSAYQRALLTDLSNLTPPASMASDWDQILAYAGTLAESTANLNEDAQTNNAKAAKPLFAIFAKARIHFQDASRRNGMAACAKY